MSQWRELREYYDTHKLRISDLFAEDSDRAPGFSVRLDDLLFDYSKTTITAAARAGLLDIFTNKKVADRRDAMFAGQKINRTEDRAVLHTALRNPDGGPVFEDGVDVMPGVRRTLARMRAFAAGVRDGSITPSAGGRFTDVVNIGIGGSDLGPAMATLALDPYADGPKTHFVSNIDGAQIDFILNRLDPKTTLLIVASKTFTTIETMTNAKTALAWLQAKLGAQATGHMVALSSALDKTAAFGVPDDRVFGFEDWVGGRYSIWGPIGLSLMLAIGADNFDAFLSGARALDRHFCDAPAERNMPVMLALTGLWHSHVCGYPSRAVLPYDQRLSRLPAYFQQLEMESNGKGVCMDGRDLDDHSGAIVWGEPGTNGQHAFYQLIHQGTRVVPCEFMVAAQGHEPKLAHQHRLLLANCLAQSEALMRGRTLDQATALMQSLGLDGNELNRQAAHRVFSGNRPSTTLIYPKLTPFALGQIIALYEHRVFVEGVILGINSFDQWGVELGKELAVNMLPLIEGGTADAGKDASTSMLLKYIEDFG